MYIHCSYGPPFDWNSVMHCRIIPDTGLVIISEQSLKILSCDQITDAGIISLSTHCTGLQSFNLGSWCQIIDASIMLISTHCTGLESLNL